MRLPWRRQQAADAASALPRASGRVRTVGDGWSDRRGEGRLTRQALPADGRDSAGRLVRLAATGPGLVRPGDVGEPEPVPLHGVADLLVTWSGEVEHRDSLGHRGRLSPPSVRLVSGGAGVTSEGGPARSLRRDGGDVDHLHVRWVQPGPPAVPTVRTADAIPVRSQGRTRIDLVVGPDGAVGDPAGARVLRVRIPAGASADLPVAAEEDVVLWVRSGAALVGPALQPLPAGTAASLVGGEVVQLGTRLDQEVDAVLVATPSASGQVVRHGLIAAADVDAVRAAEASSRDPGFGRLPGLDG